MMTPDNRQTASVVRRVNSVLRTVAVCLLVGFVAGLTLPVSAVCQDENQDETEKLAKETQNPVANLISVPIQNNTNFNYGPLDRTQNVTNIQPVIPVSLNEDWNLITRTIVPLVYVPQLVNRSETTPSVGNAFGLGDITFTAFLSPAESEKIIWGVGPALVFPTATDSELMGSGKWSLGPAAVGLYMGEKIVAGALIYNVWSVAGETTRQDVAAMTLQPFFNYNFSGGYYLTSSPILTANWNASSSDDTWTVPIGGGFGKLFRIGKLPVNTQVQAFYNIARPQDYADWTLRFQLQFLFPK